MPKERKERRLTQKEVRARALEIRNEFSASSGSVRDFLKRVLDRKNGRLEYIHESDRVETLKVRSGGDFDIYLPLDSSPVRDNFTIGHELGHLFLHTDFAAEGEASFTRRGSNQNEWQANWFAAELLMPRDDFAKAAAECGNDPYELARRFEVSASAANVRLMALGLI
jgi:Zn-dependent peptidase ImmA (M78 family)